MTSHDCSQYLEVLDTVYETKGWYSSESLKICRCKKCGQLWKIRFQWDAGTGRDDIWLKPGESKRGYSFPEEEAKKYIENLKEEFSVVDRDDGYTDQGDMDMENQIRLCYKATYYDDKGNANKKDYVFEVKVTDFSLNTIKVSVVGNDIFIEDIKKIDRLDILIEELKAVYEFLTNKDKLSGNEKQKREGV